MDDKPSDAAFFDGLFAFIVCLAILISFSAVSFVVGTTRELTSNLGALWFVGGVVSFFAGPKSAVWGSRYQNRLAPLIAFAAQMAGIAAPLWFFFGLLQAAGA